MGDTLGEEESGKGAIAAFDFIGRAHGEQFAAVDTRRRAEVVARRAGGNPFYIGQVLLDDSVSNNTMGRSRLPR